MTEANQDKALHPTIFVVFGITGDLAARKLLPALLGLFAKKLLPARWCVIGFSRRSLGREEFRELVRGRLNIRPGQFKEEDVKHFLDHVSYEQGKLDELSSYERLAGRIKEQDSRWGQCSNKLYHLSVPPALYEGILRNLASSGLSKPCADETGWTRVLIEKPFGNDIGHAEALDKLLGKLFKEEQIFRIDHYLAKETLQNILAFRFHNYLFEPIWNRRFVDKVHVKLFEQNGVLDRGDTYDAVGALKDVGQNHMLMMLSAVAMDEPNGYSAPSIRRERAKVLARLRQAPSRSAGKCNARGQYSGYKSEAGVMPDSGTETYFRLKAAISSSRWKGVPFYLESGKAMAESRTEIDVYFKNANGRMRGRNAGNNAVDNQNILTFKIQPNEGIKIKFFVKTPGEGFRVESKTLKFRYSDVPTDHWQNLPNDYERLIRDAFLGDQTLFASTDEIMASWRFITAVLRDWTKLPLVEYPRGAKEVG
ncbi:MAG: glucose-6-phosphate dehydrogenase [Patescibacteria group bacterium]|nr:glucose-6-phosphate dehydrogenase [Patescibacteria group bacterium]MDE2438677.1 glucose-6-phosphate dehydrogenase [Patescibacteria group bacterium]